MTTPGSEEMITKNYATTVQVIKLLLTPIKYSSDKFQCSLRSAALPQNSPDVHNTQIFALRLIVKVQIYNDAI